jgi:hypothetical protein
VAKIERKINSTSINSALLKIVRKELGLEKKRHTAVYHDLDHLAGTWDKKDFVEFKKNVKDFENIDETMWK